MPYMKILLSIAPEHAEAILSGNKRYEFRKTHFTNPMVTAAVIYATRPTGRVIGEFAIASIHHGEIEALWRKTHQHAGVTYHDFLRYYRGFTHGYALKIGKTRRYPKPLRLTDIDPELSAPQSFRYLRDDQDPERIHV